MKKLFLIGFVLLLIAYCLLPAGLSAQTDTSASASAPLPSVRKIAIFAPLYIDSAFDNLEEYRYAKNVFPKFINSGLEFYEGAQLAIDSLSKEGARFEVFVYDTRSAKESLEKQLNRPELRDVDLIIAHCGSNEIRVFAEAGLAKNIPVININMPNSGGTTANPFFVILNPTLKTQCEGIYKYVQRYYSINPIIVFRKKGLIEDQIKSYLEDYTKNTSSVPLKIKYVDLPEGFTSTQLKNYLDTTRKTLCIAGTLDVNFGKQLTAQLSSIYKEYPAVVLGMPTWDGIKEFSKPEFKGIEIIYGTPFYHNKTDKVSLGIINHFNNTMYARPSDMVFRGYEVTWKFAKLLLQYGKDISSNIGNKQNQVFTDFDIQPVLNKQNMSLDYFENKKLYFLKWQDGVFRSVIAM
jgi:hypothetical protein